MVDIVIAKATGSPWSEVLGHPEGHLNGQDRRTFGPWHLSLGANIGLAYREDINEKKRFLLGLPMPEFFGPLFRSAFLVNKKSLFLQKCQCIELLTVF